MILRYLWLGTLILIMIGLGYSVWWVKTLEKPSPGNSCKNGWMWDDTCTYIKEIKQDATLKSPSAPPSLINFTKSEGAGPPIFLPMWYRYRYVNVVTGGYSEFSPWSKAPVMSGECDLPCIDDKCSFTTGPGSCTFNQPVVGVDKSSIEYSPVDKGTGGELIYMNLHRYVGQEPPTDTTKDEIVGVMIVPRSGKYYTYIDVLKNPCIKGCKTPTLCSSKPCTPK